MKKYRVILHQEYTVEAETEQAAISKAEQLGLGNEYEISRDTTVQEIKEIKESNEPVKTIYITVDYYFNPDYYKESNDVYIEYEGMLPFKNDGFREMYLVSGPMSEVDSFLDEAKYYILDIEKVM